MNIDPNIVVYGNWALDLRRETFQRHGKLVRLQPGVLRLLLYIVRNEGRLISKDELVSAIWGGRAVSDAAIYNRVGALRRVILDEDGPTRCIHWQYGRGLRFARPPGSTIDGESSASPEPQPVRGLMEEAAKALLDPKAMFGFLGSANIDEMRHMLGAYFTFYRTPSWPNAIKRGLSILSEDAGRVAVRTTEHGRDEAGGIRQRARYRGFATLIDGRLYILEQNTRPPKAICLLALDAPHQFRPDIMTGLMLGSSWRLKGAPYATRVVWRRVPGGTSIRDAIRDSGPRGEDSEDIDINTRESVGPDCLTFHDPIKYL